ncbi:RHS repeat-associated core domain-containing protein [Limisphaera sp. VF-2]|uniref:RHS repeat-associated core domain-containing protein n=1 Tax=Limisphaera sp. VF-2 TaxID=3400418 RepID=UPI001817CEF6
MGAGGAAGEVLVRGGGSEQPDRWVCVVVTNLGVVRGNPDRVQWEVRSDFVAQSPETLMYDGDGNLVRDGRWVYSWDAENRLVRVMSYGAADRAGWRRVDWAYDALCRRIRQTSYVLSNGVWVVTEDLKFVSDPVCFGRHLAELNATNHALVRSYVWALDLSETLDGAGGVGGLLWVRVTSGPASGTHFVTYDGNGNVWQLVSASTGTATARYEYGPFGEPLRTTGPAAPSNPFRFSTKRTDPATGLVLYEYRAYSPSTGRWPSRDPIADFAFLHDRVRGKTSRHVVELVKRALLAADTFAGTKPIDQIDILGLENVQIVVMTVIRPPDAQAGVKTIHRVVIDEYGKISTSSTFTGFTSVLGYPVPGTSTFWQWAVGTHPNFTVTMIGDAHSAVLPPFMDIDYNFDIALNFCSRQGRLTGKHDSYPSYVVRVKGKTIHDFQQQSLSGLLGDGEVTVDKTFSW